MKIKEAHTPEEILMCFEAMQSLRPQLKRENIVDTIKGMMSRGYRLIYIDENGKVPCFSGYRYTEHLAWGKVIYIDDLGTVPEGRGKGFASALLLHILHLAKEHGCDQVHLDSGCVPQRYAAHRLYLKTGFNITSHHFAYVI
ncbi:MAG TPA: GNAT family N-acetyltransferase [Bacteroidia bacterium]|nr:GNAT family N-acetyltransferase [Bacteroidia bacterium]